jgi:hypothetical protein
MGTDRNQKTSTPIPLNNNAGYAVDVQHHDGGTRFGKIQIGPENSCGHIVVKTEAQLFSDLVVV